MHARSSVRCGIVLSLLFLCTAGARAQNIEGVLQVRTRAEGWRWFESSADGRYTYVGSLVRAGAQQQQTRLGWRLELAAPVLVGLPDNAVAAAPQGAAGLGPTYWAANDSAEAAAGLFLKQAYLRIGRLPPAGRHGLRIGRFELIDGSETLPLQTTLATLKRERIAHRLIGNFGWSHVQRSFDGLLYTYDDTTVNLTAAAVRATAGVFDTNGWPGLPVRVGYVALSRRAHAQQRTDWRVFGSYYHDARSEPVPLKADNRPLAARQADLDPIAVATFGGHYLRVLPVDSASIDLLAWGALQAGRWGALGQRAYAFALEAGWQPAVSGRPWLRAGYTRSSGDATPGDDDHGTFFQLLPTPRLYARFPFYNLMNIQDASVSLLLRPTSRLQLRAQAHQLALAESNDLWYSGGGAYDDRNFGYAGRPASGSDVLARLLDVSAELRINRKLTASAYLGWTRGGAVIHRIHPAGRTATLGYVEVEWR